MPFGLISLGRKSTQQTTPAGDGARVMRTWGLHWDWLERDPNSRIFSQVSMLLRRSGTIVAFAGAKIYRRYPSETRLASALKSVTVVAIWLPEKTAYQRVLISY